MSIQYTYQIIKVDEAARCMEVVYSADGHQTMHIGARLPFVGETLEAVIQMYAPIAFWIEQKTPMVTPAVGASGVIEGQLAPQSDGVHVGSDAPTATIRIDRVVV